MKDLPSSTNSGLSMWVAVDLLKGGSSDLDVRRSSFDVAIGMAEGHPRPSRHVLKALSGHH